MKTKGKREEAESPWLGTMCGMLKGGALAFLTAVAILFLCALAVSNRWLGQGMMDSAVMAASLIERASTLQSTLGIYPIYRS